jgi:hypothetical protein
MLHIVKQVMHNILKQVTHNIFFFRCDGEFLSLLHPSCDIRHRQDQRFAIYLNFRISERYA